MHLAPLSAVPRPSNSRSNLCEQIPPAVEQGDAARLEALSHHQDRLVRRMARHGLSEVDRPHRPQSAEAMLARLKPNGRKAASELAEALGLLEGRPDLHDGILRSLCSLTGKFHQRDKPDLASSCASYLEQRWQAGAFQVSLDGAPLTPDSHRLERMLKAEFPAVRDGVLQFSSPTRHSPEARALAQEILSGIPDQKMGSWVNPADGLKESPGVERLKTLEAGWRGPVMAALLDQASPETSAAGRGRLTTLLRAASLDPELRADLAPHLPRLSRLVSDSAARGLLTAQGRDGDHKAAYCRALIETFPEAADRRFLEQEAAPLLPGSMGGILVHWLWDKNPGLVSPGVEAFMQLSDRSSLPSGHRFFLQEAVDERGWLPSKEQMGWIAAGLYQPEGRLMRKLWDGGFKGQCLETLRLVHSISKRAPELLEGLQLPDAEGRLVPMREALWERFFGDPEASDDDLCKYLYGNLFHPEFRDLVAPPVGEGLRSLDHLEQELARAGGAVAGLSRSGKVSLVLVSYLASPEVKRQLGPLLAGSLKERHNGALGQVLDPFRKEYVAGGGHDALEVALACSASLDEAEVLPLLEGQPATDLDDLRSVLDTVEHLHELSPSQEAKLLLALRDAERDPEVREQLASLLGGHFGERQYFCHPALQLPYDRFRLRLEFNLDGLEQPEMAPEARLALAEASLAFQPRNYFEPSQVRKVVLRAFQEGARHQAPGLERIEESEQAYQAFGQVLAQAGSFEEGWRRFQQVLSRVGEERVVEALELWHGAELAVKGGRSWSEALEQGLRGYALGEQPLDVGPVGVIEKTVDAVQIGSVRLPVRK